MHEVVDRREVHKHREEAVLLRSRELVSSHAMRFMAGWPHERARSNPSGPASDVGLVAEMLRQATIALAHTCFGVPFSWAFLMDRMAVEITGSMPHDAGGLSVSLEVRAEDIATRGDRLRALVSHVVFNVDGRQFATGRGDLRVVDDRLYRRLRGEGPHLTNLDLPPRNLPDALTLLANRDFTRGVEWRVIFDPRHGLFFDHPVDHVPGMLLFEAACQVATRHSVDMELVGFDGEYHRFVDLSAPLLVRIEDSQPLDASRRVIFVCVYGAGTLAMSSRVVVALRSVARSGLDQFSGMGNDPMTRIANHSRQDYLPHPSKSLEKVGTSRRGD